MFPGASLSREDIHFVYAGVRPLPRKEDGPESAITRAHIIKRHASPLDGMLSIIGGKLTTYRSLAEEAVDKVCDLLGQRRGNCPTRDTALPGATAQVEEDGNPTPAFAALSDSGQRRLVSVYGGRTRRLAVICQNEPTLARSLDEAGLVLAAEVALAVRDEMARTLVDIVHRRLMVGLAADYDASLIAAIADVAAVEFGWSDDDRDAELEALRDYDSRLQRRITTTERATG